MSVNSGKKLRLGSCDQYKGFKNYNDKRTATTEMDNRINEQTYKWINGQLTNIKSDTKCFIKQKKEIYKQKKIVYSQC